MAAAGTKTRTSAAKGDTSPVSAPTTERDDDETSTPSYSESQAAGSNPSTEQVTQPSTSAPAEGQKLREADPPTYQGDGTEYVTIDQVVRTSDPSALSYDPETGHLVNGDGKKVALAADASDPDVGWTAQHAQVHDDRDEIPYPGGPNETPDQTFHPDELPDPVAAMRAGLLPQNVSVLNIDPDKFAGKKSLEA